MGEEMAKSRIQKLLAEGKEKRGGKNRSPVKPDLNPAEKLKLAITEFLKGCMLEQAWTNKTCEFVVVSKADLLKLYKALNAFELGNNEIKPMFLPASFVADLIKNTEELNKG
jgi:hypothetical protein